MPDRPAANVVGVARLRVSISRRCRFRPGSALAPALAVTCLATMMPRITSRRFLAVAGAVAAIVVGNFLRICSSIVVGLYAGKSSLVLFHDWVGSMIGFAFTLGGFVLMLWILLPARGPAPVPSVVTGGAD